MVYSLNLFTALHVKRMNGRLIRYKLFEMSLQFYRGISQFRSGALFIFIMQIYFNNMSVIICIDK